MGFMTYILGLVISGMLALLLRGLLRWFTRGWKPTTTPLRHTLLRPVLRAFPFAFAFAPTLLMKRGLGVIIPASLYLLPQLGGLPFQTHAMNADDWHNLSVAGSSLMVVWGVSAFIIFARQLTTSRRETSSEQTKSL